MLFCLFGGLIWSVQKAIADIRQARIEADGEDASESGSGAVDSYVLGIVYNCTTHALD
jgi:hypothetical protein